MPLVLGILAIVWAILASQIPSMLGRIGAWAFILGVAAYRYVTTVRRLAIYGDSVEIELTRRKSRIPYSKLSYVIVRAQPLAGTLRAKFVIKDPPSVIRTRTALMYDEVVRVAPQLIEALIAHGVDVRVPGRPDVGRR
jgi:hypothetical protein